MGWDGSMVVPAVNVPMNGSLGVCVLPAWSHGEKLATILDILRRVVLVVQ